MACVITADNGSTSGSAGLKSAADSSGALSIKVGSGSVTAATFDAAGNMGIGGTPSAWKSNQQAIQFNAYGSGATAHISNLGDIQFGSNFYLGSDGNYKYTQSSVAASMYQNSGGAHYWYTAASGTAGNTITFTQAMTLDASGNLLVGVTSSTTNEIRANKNGDQALYVQNSNAAGPFGFYVGYTAAAPNNSGNDFIRCADTGGQKIQLRSNGGIGNYSANDANLSDRREKTNFAPAKDYLNVLCQIPVQTFNYIDQNHEDDPGLTLGVVAQDVQAVAPELVMESNWGSKDEPKMRLSIYQTDFQYAMLKAIQELAAEVAALKGAK